MLNQTKSALEAFDNSHDFERMAADILNALGYTNVEPMAPDGGSDGGQDIKFKEGDELGIAFVTLNKKIRDKFNSDLEKQNNTGGVITLFCNVDVSPSMKLDFSREALEKRYRLEVFDLERLRSLLENSLKDIRRRYLHIDDELAAKIRSEVIKLLRFPAAILDTSNPPTLLEKMLLNKLPCRLFDLLMRYDDKEVHEVPGIGGALHDHLMKYYQFRKMILQLENNLVAKIGQIVRVRFREGWAIYLKYAIMRFSGHSKEAVIAEGDFLNYEITWDDAERVFIELSKEETALTGISELLTLYKSLEHDLHALASSLIVNNAA